MEAFVYCWTDKVTNNLYIGSHKGSIDDGYVCSSKYMLEEYTKRPDDFSRQILAEGDFISIRLLEEKILKSVDAKNDAQFYNMHNGNGKFHLKQHTSKSKLAISKGHIGKVRPDLSERNKKGPTKQQTLNQVNTKREKGYYLPENNPMFGKKHSDNVKIEQSKRMIGSKNPNFGKKLSKETKEKMSKAKKEYWIRMKEGFVNGD